jgi:hypothetical protein
MYTVKLEVGARSFAQPLEIKMDPRVKVTSADLIAQFQIASQICDAMNAGYAGLEQVRSVRQQIAALASSAPKGAVADALAKLDQKAAEMEGSAPILGTMPRQPSFAKLNAQAGQLLDIVDGADAAPTIAARAAFEEVQKSLGTVLKNWSAGKAQDIPALNEELRKAGLAPIDLSKSSAPAEDPGGDDEP